MSFDVTVQRGTDDFGASENALDVSVTAVDDVEDAFARLNNTQNASSGRTTADGANVNADDISMGCIMDAVDNIALTRIASGEDLDYQAHWELWEYIGDPGGPNEFIVREQRLQLVNSAVTTVTRDISALTNAVDDFSKLVPIVLGYQDEATGATWSLRPTLRIDVGGENLVFERTNSSSRVAVEYALVEFTGSNWQVEQNVSHTYSSAGTDETETISTIIDWDTAFIFSTHHTDVDGLDETGWTVRPGSSVTTVRFRMRSGATILTDERTIAFVVRNPDCAVEHLDSITGSEAELATGNTTQSWTITTVDTLSASGVLASADCGGTGTAYPRQFWGYTLTASAIDWRRGRSGQASDAAAQVIQFPQRVVDTDPTVQASTALTVFDVDVIRQTDPTVQASTALTVFDIVRISTETTSFATQAATALVTIGADEMKQIAQLGVDFDRIGQGSLIDTSPGARWNIDSANGNTFEIWFRIDAFEFGTSNFGRLFGRWKIAPAPVNKKFRLDIAESGELKWSVSAPTDRTAAITGLSVGITYQAICTVDYASDEIEIILSSLENGWKWKTVTTAGSVAVQSGGPPLQLGQDPNSSDANFDGMMCRLRKWDTLFSEAQLETLFNVGRGRMFQDLPAVFNDAGGNIEASFELDEISDASVEVHRFDRLREDVEGAALRDQNTFPSRAGMGFSVFSDIATTAIPTQKIIQTAPTVQASTATVVLDVSEIKHTDPTVQATTATVTISADELKQTDPTVQAETATVTISADELKQAAPTVQASTALVATSVDEIKQAAPTPQAETATTVFDIDPIAQTAPAVQAETATVTISADELKQTDPTVQATTATVTISADEIKQTDPTVQAETATVTISADELKQTDAALQSSTALVVIDADEIKQTDPTVQATTATAIVVGIIGAIEGDVAAQATTATVVLDVDPISQTSPTVQAETATVTISADEIKHTDPTVQATTALVTISADELKQTDPTVQATTATAVLDVDELKQTDPTVQALTATTAIPATKIHVVDVAVQADTATTVIDGDLFQSTGIAIAISTTALLATDADLIRQTDPTVQATTATLTVGSDLIRQTSPTVQASTAIPDVDAQRLLGVSLAIQAEDAVAVAAGRKVVQTAVAVQAETATAFVTSSAIQVQGNVVAQATIAITVSLGRKVSQATVALLAGAGVSVVSSIKISQTDADVQAETATAVIVAFPPARPNAPSTIFGPDVSHEALSIATAIVVTAAQVTHNVTRKLVDTILILPQSSDVTAPGESVIFEPKTTHRVVFRSPQ